MFFFQKKKGIETTVAVTPLIREPSGPMSVISRPWLRPLWRPDYSHMPRHWRSRFQPPPPPPKPHPFCHPPPSHPLHPLTPPPNRRRPPTRRDNDMHRQLRWHNKKKKKKNEQKTTTKAKRVSSPGLFVFFFKWIFTDFFFHLDRLNSVVVSLVLVFIWFYRVLSRFGLNWGYFVDFH